MLNFKAASKAGQYTPSEVLRELRLKVVLFDLDGVLWHSSQLHTQAFVQAFREVGFDLPVGVYAAIAGMKTEAAVSRLAKLLGLDLGQDPQTLASLVYRKRVLVASKLKSADIVDPETVSTLSQVRAAGYKTALTTGASQATMTTFLEKLPPGQWFDARICGDDVPVGKPAPAIFLAAAKQLQTAPVACVVIEDSLAGVQAALAAGMYVIAYHLKETEDSQFILAYATRLNEIGNWLGFYPANSPEIE